MGVGFLAFPKRAAAPRYADRCGASQVRQKESPLQFPRWRLWRRSYDSKPAAVASEVSFILVGGEVGKCVERCGGAPRRSDLVESQVSRSPRSKWDRDCPGPGRVGLTGSDLRSQSQRRFRVGGGLRDSTCDPSRNTPPPKGTQGKVASPRPPPQADLSRPGLADPGVSGPLAIVLNHFPKERRSTLRRTFAGPHGLGAVHSWMASG